MTKNNSIDFREIANIKKFEDTTRGCTLASIPYKKLPSKAGTTADPFRSSRNNGNNIFGKSTYLVNNRAHNKSVIFIIMNQNNFNDEFKFKIKESFKEFGNETCEEIEAENNRMSPRFPQTKNYKTSIKLEEKINMLRLKVQKDIENEKLEIANGKIKDLEEEITKLKDGTKVLEEDVNKLRNEREELLKKINELEKENSNFKKISKRSLETTMEGNCSDEIIESNKVINCCEVFSNPSDSIISINKLFDDDISLGFQSVQSIKNCINLFKSQFYESLHIFNRTINFYMTRIKAKIYVVSETMNDLFDKKTYKTTRVKLAENQTSLGKTIEALKSQISSLELGSINTISELRDQNKKRTQNLKRCIQECRKLQNELMNSNNEKTRLNNVIRELKMRLDSCCNCIINV